MGAEKDIIIAVELGSQAIRAVAGKREPDGTMQVLAVAQENAVNAIRKGLVDNIDKTSQAISRVVGTINEKLGVYTTRIYVGLSGQSLHTKLNTVPWQMEEKTQISNKLVDQLMEINSGTVYPDSRILDVIPQEYQIGTRKITDPVGMMSNHIEAHFMNVIARSALSENIERCVRNAGLELAELLISPLCLADGLLTSNEKRSGCALVDFGADTTTVLVYTNNILRHLTVIPLGGANVTHDITSKGVDTEEAEELKLKYGTAYHQPSDEEKTHNVQLSFGRSISEGELQEIIEARYEEIIFNTGNQIMGYSDKLLSGIILTGGASRIKGLTEAFSNILRFDKQVRNAKPQPTNITLSSNVHISETDNLNTLFSLLLKGDQTCVGEPPVEKVGEAVQTTMDFKETTTDTTPEAEEEKEITDVLEESGKEEKKDETRTSFKSKLQRSWEIIRNMLTDPDEV